MKTNTIASVVATARGVETLLPLITGQQDVVAWATSLAKETVTTKNGREVGAARNAVNGFQYAMTNIAMALRSATELGTVPYTQAVRETKRIYTLFDSLRAAFAGVRNEAHRELVVADVTLSVKDGVFSAFQSEVDNEPYGEQELLDMGMNWEQIEEFLEAQASKVSLGQSYLMESDGSMAADEGEFRTSVHEANQLWDMELTDIKWAEFAAAPVALLGISWPASNPMWNSLLDRLATSWAAGIEYAEDKEAAAKKVERREAAIEGLHDKPAYARWAINHVTRRVFRDLAVLQFKKEEIQGRWDYAEQRAGAEEKYNLIDGPMTRHNTMGETKEARKAFLLYSELTEFEVRSHEEELRSPYDIMDEFILTQIDQDRQWYAAQIDEVERIIARLKPLYAELRAMDVRLTKLWELFARDGMPTAPPVYWSKTAFFDDEATAHAVIKLEMAEAKAKAREAEGDALVKAAAMVAEMLGL